MKNKPKKSIDISGETGCSQEGGTPIFLWDKKLFKKVGYYGNVGFNFFAATALGFYLGYSADRALHIPPVFSVLGVIAGIGAGIFRIYQLSLKDKDIGPPSPPKQNK